jgi:hypothetical protein
MNRSYTSSPLSAFVSRNATALALQIIKCFSHDVHEMNTYMSVCPYVRIIQIEKIMGGYG